jgi:hypothetical protein
MGPEFGILGPGFSGQHHVWWSEFADWIQDAFERSDAGFGRLHTSGLAMVLKPAAFGYATVGANPINPYVFSDTPRNDPK